MGFLKRADAKFIEQAFDDSQRRAAIEQYSVLRLLGFIACVTSLLAFIMNIILYFLDQTHEQALSAGALGVCAALITAFQVRQQSDLRLLLLVEKLKNQK